MTPRVSGQCAVGRAVATKCLLIDHFLQSIRHLISLSLPLVDRN